MLNKQTIICLPNFLIAGAPKSGTTSLFYYLRQHPDIYLPVRKELHYFSYEYLEKSSNGPGDKQILLSLCSTRAEYESHYADVGDERMIGEVSPSYLYYSAVRERIQIELGKIKIIIILRNPIEKAHSQYMHMVRDNRETLSFYDALMTEQERINSEWSDIWRYAESSLYSKRIKEYISLFGAGNIKIILFDDFTSRTDEIMRDLFEFLNVDPEFVCETEKTYNRTGVSKSKIVSEFFGKSNLIKTIAKKIIPERIRLPIRLAILDINTGKKPLIDPESQKYLRDYFGDDVEELEGLLETRLNWLK